MIQLRSLMTDHELTFCKPLMYAEAINPLNPGSSEKLSNARPPRGDR